MAEPLSISATTTGFVAFALQVAQATISFIQNASEFPKEFTKLSLVTYDFASHVRRLSPAIEKIEEEYEGETSSVCVALIANHCVKIKYIH